MKKDPRVYLAHILERIERIEQYTVGGRGSFLADLQVQDAVIRNLEVIGEATKRVGLDFREANPEIPWRGMAALRDVLIHDYDEVAMAEVWSVIERELPPLKKALTASLPPLDQLEREIAEGADE
ncbi:MAG: DUF86 domain-containing protein [Deltaproteobacteria bacterium]|nr:DUF86 domain-containing protein [Deltaproteobacteria bacterium]